MIQSNKIAHNEIQPSICAKKSSLNIAKEKLGIDRVIK